MTSNGKAEKMNTAEFAKYLIESGHYIGEDNHIYSPKGTKISRAARNGYYVARKMIDCEMYYVMEHRVIWAMAYGSIDENLVINHINFDRTDNSISNLEMVTQKENIAHSIKFDRVNACFGEDNSKAILSNEEVKLIRYLCKHGYSQKQVGEMFEVNHQNLISRVVTGARYGKVPDAADVISIYPLFVQFQTPKHISKEETLKNFTMGLCSESGELASDVKKTLLARPRIRHKPHD